MVKRWTLTPNMLVRFPLPLHALTHIQNMLFQSLISLIIIFYGLVYSTLAAIYVRNPENYTCQKFMHYMPDGLTITVYFLLSLSFNIFLLQNPISLNLPIIVGLTTCGLVSCISNFTQDRDIPEMEGLFITLSGLGILLLTTSNFFIVMILIEIISLILYTLAPLGRDLGGVLAGAYYFIYGSLMAAFGYLGLLLMYSEIGSFDFLLV